MPGTVSQSQQLFEVGTDHSDIAIERGLVRGLRSRGSGWWHCLQCSPSSAMVPCKGVGRALSWESRRLTKLALRPRPTLPAVVTWRSGRILIREA